MPDLAELRAGRDRAVRALGALSEEQLGQPVPWRGQPAEVRYLLLRLADEDAEREVTLTEVCRALGWQPSEAQRILGQAVAARGQLRAGLVGLPDAQLDSPPAPGEWSVRQVLGHLLAVDRRYVLQIVYAAERLRSPQPLPVRMPDDRLPPTAADSGPSGGLAELLAALEASQAETLARLSGLTAEELEAPTIWSGWTVDARFRLHRFAAHERQHAVQVAKALGALGWRQSEAQLILGQAEVARGALVGRIVGLPGELAGRAPGGGLPSVRELLDRALAEEVALVEAVQAACGPNPPSPLP